MARYSAHRCPPADSRKNRRHLPQTKEFLMPVFLQCGKSWYSVAAVLWKITSVHEFNQPAFFTSAEPITQADTLNGVDWKGT